MIWQIKQFFKPFPEKDSWAYQLYSWMYDVGLRRYRTGKETLMIDGPMDIDHVNFSVTAKIMEAGLEDVIISTKKVNILPSEASMALIEFTKVIESILAEKSKFIYKKEIKSNENQKEIFMADTFRDPPPDIRWSHMADRRGFCEGGYYPKPESLPPLGSYDWRNSVFALPEHRRVVYMLPPNVKTIVDDDLVKAIMEEIREYTGGNYSILDYIDLKLDNGVVLGRINLKTHTIESVSPLEDGGTVP